MFAALATWWRTIWRDDHVCFEHCEHCQCRKCLY
jgi:hypothetical protein